MTERKLRLILFLIILPIGLSFKISEFISKPIAITILTLMAIFISLVIGISWWFINAFLIAKIFYLVKNFFSKK